MLSHDQLAVENGRVNPLDRSVPGVPTGIRTPVTAVKGRDIAALRQTVARAVRRIRASRLAIDLPPRIIARAITPTQKTTGPGFQDPAITIRKIRLQWVIPSLGPLIVTLPAARRGGISGDWWIASALRAERGIAAEPVRTKRQTADMRIREPQPTVSRLSRALWQSKSQR